MPKQYQRAREIVYAFIDSQNLNLGTNKDVVRGGKHIYKGWKLDFAKFHKFLTDKFRASKIFLFIGYIEENSKLYSSLESYGYTLVYKPTVSDGEGKAKGNVDAELVLHASAIEYNNYQKAVIVSGDGDFRCLHEFLLARQKLKAIIIPNKNTESTLLKNFTKYKVFLNKEKDKLEYKAQELDESKRNESVIASDKNELPQSNTVGRSRPHRFRDTWKQKNGRRRS